jgi:hypothetical protein
MSGLTMVRACGAALLSLGLLVAGCSGGSNPSPKASVT